jgi:hypothetical protein
MTIDAMRTALIWVFFLLLPKSVHEHEYFEIIQLIGFSIQVCGTLLFNEIVIIPYWGFDRYLTMSESNHHGEAPKVSEPLMGLNESEDSDALIEMKNANP